MKLKFHPTAIGVFGAIALTMALTPFAAAQRGGRTQVQLPTGEARKAILNNCTACHGIDPFGTKRLDRAGWQSLIDSMKAKGAEVQDKDIPVLLDYLVKTFGPDVPLPGDAGGRGQAGPDAAVQNILKSACTQCHNLTRVDSQNLTKPSWQDIVERMKAKGAQISDDDVTNLVEYLFRTHGPQ